MAKQLPLPTDPIALSLYRHLLRESSYLPPTFRTTIASTIKQRFRRNRGDDLRTKTRVAAARNALRVLRGANNGRRKDMEFVMNKAFGRIGYRRRELMSEFVQQQGPNDSQALEAALQDSSPGAEEEVAPSTPAAPTSRPKKLKNSFYQDWDREKLKKFIKSQMQQQNAVGYVPWPLTRLTTSRETAYLPVKGVNIWGKPVPENIVRLRTAKWWRSVASKSLPPLPKGEWELLQRLSQGGTKEPDWNTPARRPPAQPLIPDDDTAWDWEAYATQPASTADKRNSPRRAKRSESAPAGPYNHLHAGSSPSKRYFRRAYTKILMFSSRMEQDHQSQKYKFVWGENPQKHPRATGAQMEIFDGVDSKGEMTTTPPAEG